MLLPATVAVSLVLGQLPTLDNGLLRVTLDPRTAALTVTHLGSGQVFRQPDTVRDTFPEGPQLQVRRAPAGLVLDGSLDEWADAHWVALGGRARAGLLWDDEYLYAAFEVTDASVQGGAEGATDWDRIDHVAWWAGWDQVRYPARAGLEHGYAWGEWQEWAEVVVVRTDDGYRVEARSPIGHFITLQPVAPGRLFRTALTVGDEEGQQATYPSDVDLGSRPTYAVAVLVGETGEIPAMPTVPNPPSDVSTPAPNVLEYTLGVERFEAALGRVRCRARLPEGEPRLEFECQPLDGWEWDTTLSRGFLPEEPAEFIVPYYGNGILVPASDLSPPLDYLSVFGSLDMPGVGLLSTKGAAVCLLESYDYLSAILEPALWGTERALSFSVIGERDERGAPDTYRFAWEFLPQGDAMEVAAVMRRFCASQGWWKTLREKSETNPNLARLLGAPIVWGSSGADFAQEAAMAGIRRVLVAGSYSPDAIRQIVDLGYLCGEYDNYVDADEGTPPIDGVPAVPNLVRRERNGELAKGWLTLDGLHQYYSLCSHYALPAAQAEISARLATHPYNARFLDVHTAMGLAECYDEDHPLTRTQDRENKTAMLQWIRNQGLVLGGEHGRAWSVPVLDYQEGMMSCNPLFTWPAGHLVKVDREDQIGELYLEWGLNPARRIPFWEMVFHGCVVSTWYWGDSIGYLEDVRPDLTDRKIAMTALYGTAPLMWATDLGLGFEGQGKLRFLQTYNAICPLHEVVGWEELLSFEYLTEDRMVQRTRFRGGTEVTANFGQEPVAVTSAGRQWVLPQNGMVADGPGVHAHHLPGQETYAELADYRALVSHGGVRQHGGLETSDAIAMARLTPEHVRIYRPFGHGTANLARIAPEVDGDTVRRVVSDDPTAAAGGVEDIYFGDSTLPPDLGLELGEAREEDRSTHGLIARVRVTNRGRTAGRGTLSLYWDRVEANRLEATWPIEIEAGGERWLPVVVAEPKAVGTHRAILQLDTDQPELVSSDNRREVPVELAPRWEDWPFAVSLEGPLQPAPGCFMAPIDLSEVPGASEADLRCVAVVTDHDGAAAVTPCQFEPDEPDGLRGSLVIASSLPEPAEGIRQLVAPSKGMGLLGPVGGRADLDSGRVRGGSYAATLDRGALRQVRVRAPGVGELPVIERMIFSSAETGWGEDDGELVSMELLADGPVRTVVACVTLLPRDVRVTRRYELHDRFLIVDVTATDLCAGLFNRVWYAAEGEYLDSAGTGAVVDGRGDAEGVTEQVEPRTWYAVRGDGWTHLCVALGEPGGMSYWDSTPALGQLGFTTSRTSGNRYLHLLEPRRLDDAELLRQASSARSPTLSALTPGTAAAEGR